DRTDGVDDEPRGQAVAAGEPGLPGGAAADEPTLLDELRPRGAVDGAVDTAAAQQRRVRRVDDRVADAARDVAPPGVEPPARGRGTHAMREFFWGTVCPTCSARTAAIAARVVASSAGAPA